MAGKRRAEESAPREGQFVQPVGPSTSPTNRTRRDSRPRHAAPDDSPPKKRAPRKAASSAKPTSSAAGPAPARIGVPGAAGRAERRVRRAADEARDYANRAAYRQAHGKPSVTGRALGGAAAGAAAGASIGGPPGAVVGGGVGAVGGGLAGRSAKKAYKAAMRTNGRARRVLVVEFMLCLVIIGLSPLTDRRKDEPPGTWLRRMAAVLGLFFLLGLMSAAGERAASLAAGVGGLVTVALAVSERNVFAAVAAALNRSGDGKAGQVGDTGKVGRRGQKTVQGPGADFEQGWVPS